MARPQYPLLVALILTVSGGAAPLCAQQTAVRRYAVPDGPARGRVPVLFDLAGHVTGRRPPAPAVVLLDTLPPLWRRYGSMGIAFIVVVAAVVGVARYRVNRLLELERLRRQIAVDLHDDIGSGLAEIAILSEVARRGAHPEASAMLGHSAELARSLRESMDDIVWSVDPRQDRLLDLVHRMRQVTYSLLEVNGVEVEFTAPDDGDLRGIGLGPDRRRHVLLIFKEAIANIARHSGAQRARIALALARGRLDLTIEDDGNGFDPNAESRGQGLRSMRERAEELGARFEFRSTPGRATALDLSVPLKRPGRHRKPR